MRFKILDVDSGRSSERGVALIVVLLIMMLMSALMIGFSTIVSSDQKFRGIDKDRTRAYYGATSGLEKLTADLGNLFLANVAPTAAQIANLSNLKPSIPSVTFTAPNGMNPYGVTLVPCNAAGALACSGAVTTGPYQGLMALKQLYRMDVVAKTTTSGEVHLTRNLETVAIPVFQFGMFSDVDLSFFAGPNFNFGGRIHTNGNLFLAQGDNATLTLNQKVTALKEVVRAQLQNGVSITDTTNGSSHNGTISMANGNNSFRNLLINEGSVTAGLNPKTTNTAWPTISLSTYNGYIRNGATGAKPLNLALVGLNGTNTDMVRRPPVNENVTNPVLFGERMFGKVSVRILLSDTAADITSLPTVTPTAPIQLGDEAVGLTNDWSSAGQQPAGINQGGTVIPGGGLLMPPIARTSGTLTLATTANTPVVLTPNVVPINPGGVNALGGSFNVPGVTAGASSMQFQICTVNTQNPCTLPNTTATINCLTAGTTTATPTQIVFGTCLSSNSTSLPTVTGKFIIVNDVNGKWTAYPTVGTVTPGTSGVTKNYTVTSTAATDNYITNSFWMKDTGTNLWTLVTCYGVQTGTNTQNSGVPGFAINAFNNCNTGVGNPVPTTTFAAGNTNIINGSADAANVGTIGGYIKIEIQKTDLTWQDVTAEILNWGFADKNQEGGVNCGDPTPNAIIRLQRLRDINPGATVCTHAGSTNSYDYWPNTLFDTREGLMRDVAPGTPDAYLGGVMHYVAIDVRNLSLWLQGAAPYNAGSGPLVYSNNGYAVYFSDRRNNRTDATVPLPTGANAETGEYGFEDFVNANQANGLPNGILDVGEDVNGDGVLQTYGQKPSFLGVSGNVPPGAAVPLNAASRPTTLVGRAYGETNRAILFRRALKLQNGKAGNIVLPGLSIIAENPVYVQGDWNADNAVGGWTNNPAATSVIADAVTLLSNSWTDANGWANPYNIGLGGRIRTGPSWYRMAIIGGKGMAFPYIAGNNNDFGTDGGAHNFLRYLEGNGGQTVNYQGAIATFFYNRQAVGTYKCCNTVYSAPTRNYFFDVNFLNPALLPPLTPVFRDVNITGFSQETRPGR